MHIVISWDIKTSQPHWGTIDTKMQEGLSGYSWVRPLSTFYVVKTVSEQDRAIIRDRLLKVAKSASKTVHFILSPTMSGGRYDGYLPNDSWEKLNERSDS